MLLSGGKHPLYENHDTEESYMEKLENPEWVFPSSFNRYKLLGPEFFLILTIVDIQKICFSS